MPTEERLVIDFGDGVAGLDRTMRAITMLAAEAIGQLTELGWTRKTVNLEVNEADPLPCYVTLRRKRVYEIKHIVRGEGVIEIKGEWLKKPSKPGIIDKFWGV
jgi:hypothetical protein